MQSDDTFRRAFEAATARLSAWAEAQRDAADVDCEAAGDFWRLSLAPHAAKACPVELILHRQTQTFDLQVGRETWEGEAIADLGIFETLLQAIVDGQVVSRRLRSAATDAPLGTYLTIGTGPSALRFMTVTETGKRIGLDNALVRNEHWVAYRRA
jgi:hypothetical protein